MTSVASQACCREDHLRQSREDKRTRRFFAATAGFYCRATDYFIGIMRKPCNGSFSDIIRLTCVVRETELLCRPPVKPLLAKYDFEKSV